MRQASRIWLLTRSRTFRISSNMTGDADTTLKFGSELEDGVDTNVWSSIESVSGVWPHFWMIVGIGTCGVVTRCAHFTQHRMVIKKIVVSHPCWSHDTCALCRLTQNIPSLSVFAAWNRLDVENLLDTRRDDIFCLPWIHELCTIVTYATPRWSCGDGRKERACCIIGSKGRC